MFPAASAGRDLPRGHQQREVPGHDQADHADRLAQGQVEPRLRHRDRLAEDLVRGAGVVVEHEAHPGDLAARSGDRLAHVPALELGELLGVLLDQGGELGQRPPALAGRPGRPALALVERPPGGGHGAVHVGRATERRGRDDACRSPGSTTSNVWPSAASSDSPPMTMRVVSVVVDEAVGVVIGWPPGRGGGGRCGVSMIRPRCAATAHPTSRPHLVPRPRTLGDWDGRAPIRREAPRRIAAPRYPRAAGPTERPRRPRWPRR